MLRGTSLQMWLNGDFSSGVPGSVDELNRRPELLEYTGFMEKIMELDGIYARLWDLAGPDEVVIHTSGSGNRRVRYNGGWQ